MRSAERTTTGRIFYVCAAENLFGAYPFACLIKEHVAGSNFYLRLGKQPPFAENIDIRLICTRDFFLRSIFSE